VQVVEFWGWVKHFLLPTILFDVVKKVGRQLSYLTSLRNPVVPICTVDPFGAWPDLCTGSYAFCLGLLAMARTGC